MGLNEWFSSIAGFCTVFGAFVAAVWVAVRCWNAEAGRSARRARWLERATVLAAVAAVVLAVLAALSAVLNVIRTARGG